MKIKPYILVLLGSLILFGCGGGGGGGNSTGSNLSRAQVEELLRSGIAGIGNLPSPGSGRSVDSKAPRPAGESGFQRKLLKRSPTRAPEGIYYDSELELWAQDFVDGYPSDQWTWGTHYYIDEEATLPAGGDIWTSTMGSYPITDHEVLTITAGPWAGLTTTSHMEMDEEGRGTEVSSGFVPGEGPWEYTMSYMNGGLATIDAKYTDLEGAWTRYEAVPHDDGTYSYTITTSVGLKMALVFEPDYSGQGTLTGPSESLPATIAWDETGEGLITWKDGSTSPFNIWEF